MSIKLRLALLLGLLLLGFIGAFLVLRVLERRELEQMLAEDRRARSQLLNHWVDLASRALPQFATEAAQSEDFAGLLARGENEESPQKISAALGQAGAHFLWIMRGDGTPRAEYASPGKAVPRAFPLSATEFKTVAGETPNARFFAESAVGLLEICVRRLVTKDPELREWVVVARLWDEAQQRALAQLTESVVEIGGPAEINQPVVADSHIVLLRTLADWQGQALRTLKVAYDATGLGRTVQTDWEQGLIFLAFGLLVLVAVALALQDWVLRPLSQIGESLAQNDAKRVEKLSAEKSELGRVAELVRTSFEQRDALQRSDQALRQTLEERARLGRDLHDGVIQSLYAAGMGLAGIRASLNPEQTEAAARLEQTRVALNETIHDVRNFIIGLEPEALKEQAFAPAVTALLDSMRGIREFRSEATIDETLAAGLSLAQRVHALQIAREAVSNALRHGLANHVTVSLRRIGESAEFEVADDGTGFDPAVVASRGNGLRNLAQRARELGAELDVDSRPGRGARVRLVFSLSSYD